MMAPEVPSQQCVPSESSGLRVYTRVFVSLRLKSMKFTDAPESCRLSRSRIVLARYPVLSVAGKTLRCCISRSPLRSQDSQAGQDLILYVWLNEILSRFGSCLVALDSYRLRASKRAVSTAHLLQVVHFDEIGHVLALMSCLPPNPVAGAVGGRD